MWEEKPETQDKTQAITRILLNSKQENNKSFETTSGYQTPVAMICFMISLCTIKSRVISAPTSSLQVKLSSFVFF